MKLSVWTYEGPPHVGAMRIATAMRDVHYVLHAPQGDTYADLLFTMIERRDRRPPVTYTTFQARDLGKDTADLFRASALSAYERFSPGAMIVGSSCTAELIQDDPGGLARALGLPIPVIPLDLPSYQKRETWGASETLYQLVRALAPAAPESPARADASNARKTCNLLGPTALGFHHRDDLVEIGRILDRLGIAVNVVAPLGASVDDLRRLPDADFNIVLYPEIAGAAASWLEKTHGQPAVRTLPLGLGATREFIAEVATLAGVDPTPALEHAGSRSSWWSRSADSNYLTGKRVFVFGESLRAVAAARVAADELGFEVVGLGGYNREFAREVRTAAALYGVEPLVTDDHLEVERAIEAAQPELVLGTQMERHIAKRLGIACAVISPPAHVQDFPARYSPHYGFEGANVLFDAWVHPLVMGLEEHLLSMFRDDFEFNDEAGPSHLAMRAAAPPKAEPQSVPQNAEPARAADAALAAPAQTLSAVAEGAVWTAEAQAELGKIPFFVRGKARRNTERFAAERGITPIQIETMYDARSHFSR
jgi:light-independent protochlorophyllide reductase subunit B